MEGIFNQESKESKPFSIRSEAFDDGEPHRLELLDRRVTVTHCNGDHHQDAFAVEGNSFVVCDGAGSYGRSGIVAQMLSDRLAKLSNTGLPFEEIFKEENIKGILAEISESPKFKEFQYKGAVSNPSNATAGKCTVLVARLNTERDVIEFASVGDSPLVVIDKDANGKTSFVIANDKVNGVMVNSENFKTEEMEGGLKETETSCLGVDQKGTPYFKDLKKIERGEIKNKAGRHVMLASDFFTKMMVGSPERSAAKEKWLRKRGDNNPANALEKLRKEALATGNIFTRTKFHPEIFTSTGVRDIGIPNVNIKSELKKWTKMGLLTRAYVDDATAISIELSGALKAAKEESSGREKEVMAATFSPMNR